MPDELQAYIDRRYAKASFRVVPGHLPTFGSKEAADRFFADMESQLNAFIAKEPVTQYQFDMMAHAVGLDYHKHKPYTRSGKLFTRHSAIITERPTRAKTTTNGKNSSRMGTLKKTGGNHRIYYLTDKGLNYVAKRYGIKKITEVG